MSGRRLIVKFGTESLKRDGQLCQTTFDAIAGQVTEVMESGTSVMIVSSGALQAGREEARALGRSAEMMTKPVIAAVGSQRLMAMWGRAFAKHSILVGQVWITYANLHLHEGERESIANGLRNCESTRVVPIINENDFVSDREIVLMDQKISENDRLTRMIAEVVGPDAVLFITLAGGVYEVYDQKRNNGHRMYRELNSEALPEGVIYSESKTDPENGMGRKVEEAALCRKCGCRVAIADIGTDAIIRFANGEAVGTVIGNRNRFW